MEKSEIRTQLRAAINAKDATTNFQAGTSTIVIDQVIAAMMQKPRISNVVESIELQAGTAPNYNIFYKS